MPKNHTMKKTNNYVVVILLLVLLTTSRTQAQNVTLKMGPTIETKMSSINLAGIKDNELYALQFKREMFSFKSKPEIFLERYDNAFNKKKSSQLVMPNNKKNNDIL